MPDHHGSMIDPLSFFSDFSLKTSLKIMEKNPKRLSRFLFRIHNVFSTPCGNHGKNGLSGLSCLVLTNGFHLPCAGKQVCNIEG